MQNQQTNQSKNKTIEFCVLTETCTKVSNSLRELNGVKRKLHREFIAEVCDGDKKKGKERIGKFFAMKEREEDKENCQVDDDSVGSEDLYGGPDSQESLLLEMYDLDKEIKDQKDIRDTAKATLMKRKAEL